VETLAGDPVAAERELRAGHTILEAMGERAYYYPIFTALLAHALCAQGRCEEGLRLAEASERTTTPGDRGAPIIWYGARGKALAGLGRLDEAEAAARAAVGIAEGTDFLWDHADALMDLAEVLRVREHGDEAAASVRAAVELYERKGIVAAARRAREQLGAAVL
jgi:tetratricopeptide (TPR) repeat protein